MRLLPKLVVLAVSVAATASVAQSLKPDEVLSSIVVHVLSEPNPVFGADGRVHLAYELFVVNPGKLFVTIDRIEALDDGGQQVGLIEGD